MIGPSFDPHVVLSTMQAVAASATAMQAVAANTTARSAILNSPTAMSIVGASSMAIGKLVAGIAGLNPADYADMQAVAASATAMQAVAASATAMQAVAASAAALAAICRSSTAAVAVKSAIQGYRSQVVSTLNASIGSKFTKSQVSVGTYPVGTFDHGLNTNTIYIPVQIIDTSAGSSYKIYYGADTSYLIGDYNVGSHNSPYAVLAGVSLRGVRLVKSGTGGGDERLVCDVYTAI